MSTLLRLNYIDPLQWHYGTHTGSDKIPVECCLNAILNLTTVLYLLLQRHSQVSVGSSLNADPIVVLS